MSTFGIIAPPLIGLDLVLLESVVIIAALRELGFQIKEEMKAIKAAHGCKTDAEIVCGSKVHPDIDIGFKKRTDGSYECVADWGALEKAGLNRDEFVRELAQKYSYIKTIDAAQKEGYHVVEETSEVDGSIRVILRRYD